MYRIRTSVLSPWNRWFASSRLIQDVDMIHFKHDCHVHLQVHNKNIVNITVKPSLDPTQYKFQVYTKGPEKNPTTSIAKDGDLYKVSQCAANVNVQSIGKHTDSHDLRLCVPPTTTLKLQLQTGSVDIQEKLEGSLNVAVGDGDIQVHKVRGEDIQLKTSCGAIHVYSLIEGQSVSIVAPQINCKRLLAKTAEVGLLRGSLPSTFGAVYSTYTSIQSHSNSKLHVGNMHGYMRILGDGIESIEIQSANGALDIEDTGANCSALVHYDVYAHDTPSNILVGGDIHVSLEPTIKVDVELHGSTIDTSDCQLTDCEMDHLDEEYSLLKGTLRAVEISESDGLSSGKIDVKARKAAANETSFYARESIDKRTPRLLMHSPNGALRLEQINWIHQMSRRYNRDK